MAKYIATSKKNTLTAMIAATQTLMTKQNTLSVVQCWASKTAVIQAYGAIII